MPIPAGFLKQAVDVVHQAGGLFISDEVQPGFGRTGTAMWGFQRHGVEPDIVTMGKPMGNGFPVGGVVTRPEILESFCETTGYFNTFGGNPVAAAAGLAVLEVIDDEGLVENAKEIGGYFRAGLREIAGRHPEHRRCAERWPLHRHRVQPARHDRTRPLPPPATRSTL